MTPMRLIIRTALKLGSAQRQRLEDCAATHGLLTMKIADVAAGMIFGIGPMTHG